MRNADVMQLFDMVSVGTEVDIQLDATIHSA
jgi:lipoprotein-anchoring transpeptidase ErfK/SrfK